MLICTKKLEVMLGASQLKASVVQKNNQTLLAIVRCEVHSLGFDDGLTLSSCCLGLILELDDLSKVEVIITAAFRLSLFPL